MSTPDESTLAIGIVTAPRDEPTLARTLASVRRAGWSATVHVFAEPGSALDGLDDAVVVHQNPEKLGAFQNWEEAWFELATTGSAPFALMFEDDVELCCGAFDILGQALETLPLDDLGYISLMTTKANAERRTLQPGWNAPDNGRISWGSQGICIPRQQVIPLLTSNTFCIPSQRCYHDHALASAITELGLKSYFHSPSLAEHIGWECSTIGHSGMENLTAFAFDPDYGMVHA